jgi:GNAT superfamily N-acetyltransferase
MTPITWYKDDYHISTDHTALDIDLIHRYLAQESYWAKGVPRSIVAKSIQHSLCFGVFQHHEQVGFARAITDYTTFAYLADVFIIPAHQGHGLGKWLIECIRAHPDLQHLRRWMLATADAHGLYTQYGFTPLPQPEMFMQCHIPHVYDDFAE